MRFDPSAHPNQIPQKRFYNSAWIGKLNTPLGLVVARREEVGGFVQLTGGNAHRNQSQDTLAYALPLEKRRFKPLN